MANEQNLKPVRTKSEARKRGSAGGKKSGEVRREKMRIRKLARLALDLPCKTGTLDDVEDVTLENYEDMNITIRERALFATIKKATEGDDYSHVLEAPVAHKLAPIFINVCSCSYEPIAPMCAPLHFSCTRPRYTKGIGENGKQNKSQADYGIAWSGHVCT